MTQSAHLSRTNRSGIGGRLPYATWKPRPTPRSWIGCTSGRRRFTMKSISSAHRPTSLIAINRALLDGVRRITVGYDKEAKQRQFSPASFAWRMRPGFEAQVLNPRRSLPGVVREWRSTPTWADRGPHHLFARRSGGVNQSIENAAGRCLRPNPQHRDRFLRGFVGVSCLDRRMRQTVTWLNSVSARDGHAICTAATGTLP